MRRLPARDALALASILVAYLALVVPTLVTFGVLWDEQTDLDVALSYVAGPGAWLTGSEAAPTQARLPMYVGAIALAIFHTPQLLTARLVSCAVSLVTLLVLYLFARHLFGRTQAIVATAIVATSPFFLAFSRIAFTEGDAFITAGVTTLVATLVWTLERRTAGRAVLTGLAFGCTAAAKFVGVGLAPALLAAPWLVPGAALCGPRRDRLRIVAAAAATLLVAALLLTTFYLVRPAPNVRARMIATLYVLGLIAFVGLLVYARQHRGTLMDRFTLPLLAWLVGATTFLLIPPPHLTRPVIAGSLAHRLVESAGVEATRITQTVSLHVLTLLLKPSLLVGLLLWAGFLLAVWHAWRQPVLRGPVLCVLAYLALLAKMPLGQTFYTMPVFPLMVLLATDRFVVLLRGRTRMAILVGGACAMSIAVDLALCFPHYQVNGYQWLGARYVLGTSTIGYRSVVQVNTDGVEQALAWVNRHARAGDRVKTYIVPSHLLRALAPNPAYTLIDGFRPPSSELDRADYVITTLHGEIQQVHPAGMRGSGSVYQYPYDRAALHREYLPVLRIVRPFGLEFATVWRRRLDADPRPRRRARLARPLENNPGESSGSRRSSVEGRWLPAYSPTVKGQVRGAPLGTVATGQRAGPPWRVRARTTRAHQSAFVTVSPPSCGPPCEPSTERAGRPR